LWFLFLSLNGRFHLSHRFHSRVTAGASTRQGGRVDVDDGTAEGEGGGSRESSQTGRGTTRDEGDEGRCRGRK